MFVLRNVRGPSAQAGMTLIDVLVGSAIALIIFLAVFQLLRASALISTLAAETAAATAIGNTQMEYIRSLPYDSVGTVGGIPSGLIAQNATTTEDNVNYAVRTFIDYYDDPADGTGASDANGIITDYKRAKVSVSFTTTTGPHTVSSVSNISPPGVETTTGGGTLRISVVDSSGAALPGVTVAVVNPGTTPAVNLSTFTDATGAALLPGAFAATGYQITVSKTGYSTAKTYDRDTTNQNPSPGHLTVATNQTTSGTFAIDRLASFTLQTELMTASGTVPLPAIAFTLTGAKTVGSTGAGAPIYKTSVSGTTDSAGSASATLEWDTYALSIPGYDITDACPMPPYNVLAASDTVNSLVIGSSTTNALLVSTKDATGTALASTTVTLSRSGFTKTVSSSACGTAYFGGVSAASDYSISATNGSLTASYVNVPVSGFSTYAAMLQ